jgi:hypothetical protein
MSDIIADNAVDMQTSPSATEDAARAEFNRRFDEQNPPQDAPKKAAAPATETVADDQTEAAKPELTAEELFELKWSDGKDYKVPAVFKDILQNSDKWTKELTQKSQRLADEERQIKTALESEFERVQQQRQFVKEMAKAENLNARLEAYKDIDWVAWASQDPAAAQRHQVIANALRDELGGLQTEISKRVEGEKAETERGRMARIMKAQEQIRESIPDWGPERAKEITQFAVAQGAPMEMLNELNEHPWAVKLLNIALASHKATTAAQPQNQPQPSPTPVPKVGGSAPSAKNPDQLSTEEWMRWRTTDITKKRNLGQRVH